MSLSLSKGGVHRWLVEGAQTGRRDKRARKDKGFKDAVISLHGF